MNRVEDEDTWRDEMRMEGIAMRMWCVRGRRGPSKVQLGLVLLEQPGRRHGGLYVPDSGR